MSAEDKQLMNAALVAAARGLRGEVALNVRTDRPQDCFYPGAVLTTDSSEYPQLTIEGINFSSGKTLVFFEEITTREEAEALRGTHLQVEAQSEDDAWYTHELAGLAVRDTEGKDLGVVTDLQPGAAQDLLVVEYQGQSVWVPFVEELVPTVDVKGGFVIVDPPLGLFGDDDQIG